MCRWFCNCCPPWCNSCNFWGGVTWSHLEQPIASRCRCFVHNASLAMGCLLLILLSSIVQQQLQFKAVSCYLKSPRAGNCKSTPMFDTPSYKYNWWNENTNTRAEILDTKCKSTPLFDTPSYNTSGEIGTAGNYCPEHLYWPHKTLDVWNIGFKMKDTDVQIYNSRGPKLFIKFQKFPTYVFRGLFSKNKTHTRLLKRCSEGAGLVDICL